MTEELEQEWIEGLPTKVKDYLIANEEKLHAEMDANLLLHRKEIAEIKSKHQLTVEEMRLYRERQSLAITSYDDRLRRALTAIEEYDFELDQYTKSKIAEAVSKGDFSGAEALYMDIVKSVKESIIKAHGGQKPGRKISMEGKATGTSTARGG